MVTLLSAMRARLALFDHAYAVAIRLRLATGHDQFILKTGDPLQPVRVTETRPDDLAGLLALIL